VEDFLNGKSRKEIGELRRKMWALWEDVEDRQVVGSVGNVDTMEVEELRNIVDHSVERERALVQEVRGLQEGVRAPSTNPKKAKP
jgi:hypothetical protein